MPQLIKEYAESRILVADDNDDIRELIIFILTDAGFHAMGAADGDEALAVLHSGVIDLALLDVMMPGKSGLSILKAIRNSPESSLSALPVILISAKSQGVDIDSGLALGANSYIVKPFKAPALLSEISSTLASIGAR
jgi:CheY-like chemotaxis protein